MKAKMKSIITVTINTDTETVTVEEIASDSSYGADAVTAKLDCNSYEDIANNAGKAVSDYLQDLY